MFCAIAWRPTWCARARRWPRYANERDRLLAFAPQPFFVNDQGARVGDCGARYNFALVSQRLGLRSPQRYGRHGRGPRIHDLRHSFAVRTIIGWYRQGQDPAREMIKLTTYLGHDSPENTYWYFEATPELLELASQRITGPSDGEAARARFPGVAAEATEARETRVATAAPSRPERRRLCLVICPTEVHLHE